MKKLAAALAATAVLTAAPVAVAPHADGSSWGCPPGKC